MALDRAEQRARLATAALEQEREQLQAWVDAEHDRLRAAVAEEPAAKRVAEAEQARWKAEGRLREALADHEQTVAALQRRGDEQRRGLGAQLDVLRAELTRATGEAAGLRAELDQQRARVAELQERLRPKTPEMEVLVRFTRDTTASIGDVRVAGRGPVYGRRDPQPGVPGSVSWPGSRCRPPRSSSAPATSSWSEPPPGRPRSSGGELWGSTSGCPPPATWPPPRRSSAGGPSSWSSTAPASWPRSSRPKPSSPGRVRPRQTSPGRSTSQAIPDRLPAWVK